MMQTNIISFCVKLKQAKSLMMWQTTFESPEETGLTFVENAILKARYAAEKSGLPAIADDSGLVVDALNGAPGLYSARYAGVDGEEADAKNREKLLAELADVPTERRQAKFVSTIVLLQHPSDPSPIIAQGAVSYTHLSMSIVSEP